MNANAPTPNSMPYMLGVDLAQDSFDVAVAVEGTPTSQWRQLPHAHIAFAPDSSEGIAALLQWLPASVELCTCVVVESTGKLSQRFARALRGRSLPEVCILNPQRTKAFGDSLGIRNKTDRIDSAVLAMFALTHRPAPVQSGSPAEEQLRELTRLRQSYDRDLTAWKNRLRQADSIIPRHCVEQTIRHLEQQIEQLDQSIENLLQGDAILNEQVQNLKKIRCVKQVVATTLTAELGDLRNYDRGEIVAKAGLFATRFESGSSVWRPGKLAKRGGAPVRRALYMAATSVWRSKGQLRQYAERLEKRGMKRIQVNMALMRKLLLICRAVAINGGLYDESLILKGVTS